ncbi:MAG: fatty acid desaturase [Acidimicrobiales bacterium]
MPKVLEAFIIAFILCQVALLATTVFMHRALAHRALTLSGPVKAVFRVIVWMLTGMRPRQWVAVHRKHHAFTDIVGDPHSPVLEGFWTVQLNNAALYRRCVRDGDVVKRYARDVPADRWDRVLFDHAILGLAFSYAIGWLIFGWEVVLLAAAFHAALYLLLNAAVNAVGHAFGKRVYDNQATNNQWLAFLVLGEGLHNNHHAAPANAKLAHASREIDPGWWFISLLVRTGQARIRLNDLHLVEREPRIKASAG